MVYVIALRFSAQIGTNIEQYGSI